MASMILSASAILLFLYGLHRLFLWMEQRGWVYYWHRKSSGASIGNALMQAQTFLQPDVQHVIDEMREDKVHEEWSGDPPIPGTEKPKLKSNDNPERG
jgi:hypothetical protein